MVGYFYIWWDLEGSIWAADGRWGRPKDRFVGEWSARGRRGVGEGLGEGVCFGLLRGEMGKKG